MELFKSACILATLGDSRCIFALAHLRGRLLHAALKRLEKLEPQKCSQDGTNFRLTKVMYIPADMAVNPPHTPLRDSLIVKIAGKAVSAVAWHSLCSKGDVDIFVHIIVGADYETKISKDKYCKTEIGKHDLGLQDVANFQSLHQAVASAGDIRQ